MSIKADNTNSQSENHKKTAGHLIAAAAHHFKAANHLNNGNYEKASEHALLAQEYLNLASETKREIINKQPF
jgi:uncharacterized protein Yka (UPF0111/DUF47 family)